MNAASRLRRAADQLARGQVDAAIETLAQLLGDEPDDADAHALLALCLVRRKRLHAARMEAEAALRLAPDDPFPHRALASVLAAARRYDEALAHLHTARTLAPDDADIEVALAGLQRSWNRLDAAAAHAQRARELAPDAVAPLEELAEIAWARGHIDEAEALARAALAIDPESIDALVLVGQAALARGRIDAAREHAAWALQQDPEDVAAIALLCAIKARESLWLGLWWRFQAFVTRGSGGRTVALLLGLFLAYRAAAIVLENHGREDIADVLSVAWLGFAVYTWVAPALFLRALRRDLDQVRLRPGF